MLNQRSALALFSSALPSRPPRRLRVETPQEMVSLCEWASLRMTGEAGPAAVSLLLGTAAVESGWVERTQRHGGPARGLWQMEPWVGVDLFWNWLRYRPETFDRLLRAWLNAPQGLVLSLSDGWCPSEGLLRCFLQEDDCFAACLARLQYYRQPGAIPSSLVGQAGYWKAHWNTPEGKGTTARYLAAWEELGCQQVMAEWEVSRGSDLHDRDGR